MREASRVLVISVLIWVAIMKVCSFCDHFLSYDLYTFLYVCYTSVTKLNKLREQLNLLSLLSLILSLSHTHTWLSRKKFVSIVSTAKNWELFMSIKSEEGLYQQQFETAGLRKLQ